MMISCLTVYVITFSSAIILGKSYATNTSAINVAARENHRKSTKINFHGHVNTNGSTSKFGGEHLDAVLPYFASFDPIRNLTMKVPVHSSGLKYVNSVEKAEQQKMDNFIEWDVLRDSEKEVRIRYNGIMAKETSVNTGVNTDTGRRQGLKLRQLTDGVRFIQLIYNFDDEIQDCDYVREKTIIKKFIKSFRENVENIEKRLKHEEDEEEDDDYLEDDEGKIEKYYLEDSPDVDLEKEYRNVTFQVIKNDGDLPKEFAEWMNYSKLKRKCRENLRILKQLAYNKKHGNGALKKLAEEHIERRKRDIMDVLLVPGTKWCGKGRRATKYTSLGGFSKTDKCCRVHDTMCPHWIGSLEEKYGLFNWRINTIMHCRCDKRFRACLKMAKTGTANFVGKLFFNVVQTKCFVLKPQKVCSKYSHWGVCEKTEYRKKAYLKDNLSY